MILRLEAFSPPEGIGIIRVGDKLRLIRPPYLLRESPLLPEDSIGKVITKHGYLSSGQEFPTWDDAIDFLNSQVVGARQILGLEIPHSIGVDDVIRIAPLSVLYEFLDRIEKELIPQRMFDVADDILIAILDTDSTNFDLNLARRAGKLLRLIRERREAYQRNLNRLGMQGGRFISLERNHQMEASTRAAEAIKARGSIFAPTC